MVFTGWGDGWAEPDLIWVTHDMLTDELLESNKPIIVEDYRTSPDIYDDVRKILDNINVRAIVKMMALSDRKEYNTEHINYSAHQHRIVQASDLEYSGGYTGRPFTDLEIPNIRSMWNWMAWSLFRPARGGPKISFAAYQFRETKLDNEREYDVHFLGNPHFDTGDVPHASKDYNASCEILSHHRKLAIDAMEKVDCNKLVSAERMRRLEYLQSMQKAKIVVSPWGWEPVTYRDFEAALCGCVVVKPDTSFVDTWPQVPYIPCRVDYSDLGDIIEQILSNWDSYHEHRLKAYETLINIDDTTLYGRFANIAKDYVFKDVI